MAFCNSYASALESYVNNYGVATEGERFDMFKSGAKNVGRNIMDAIKRMFEMIRNAAARLIARIKDAIFRAKAKVKKDTTKPDANSTKSLAMCKKLIGALNSAVPKYNSLIGKIVTTSKSTDTEVVTDRLERIETEINKVGASVAAVVSAGEALNLKGLSNNPKLADMLSNFNKIANTHPNTYVQIATELASVCSKVHSVCTNATSIADKLAVTPNKNGETVENDSGDKNRALNSCAKALKLIGSELTGVNSIASKLAAANRADVRDGETKP